MSGAQLTVLPGTLAVCRLDAAAPLPAWPAGDFITVTRTGEELSIVCDEQAVPAEIRAERGWRLLKASGPIPFEVTGVAAALTAPLAQAQISVFMIATFDTDYLLVREDRLTDAIAALQAAGHRVSG